MSGRSPASDFAVALLGEFVRLGVRDVVLSPGSRSQALALAAAEFERAGTMRLSVRIDERVAGFLALGLAVETKLPALVITTSGTAVANLHPAVLEAHHAGVPLILLTADRPEELRGIGSNQTTDQGTMFGPSVRMMREVEAPGAGGFDAAVVAELAHAAFSAAVGQSSAAGPVQLNIAFREPLSGTVPSIPAVAVGEAGLTPRFVEPFRLEPKPYTVVIAGHGAGERAEAAARALAAPLVAEVTSGARFGPNLVVAYRELLASPEFGGRVRRVVVFGHPTLSREVPALIAGDDVETILVRGPAVEDYNPGRKVRAFVDDLDVAALPEGATWTREWPGRWVAASRVLVDEGRPSASVDARTDDSRAVAEFARAQLAVYREPVTRRMLVEALWKATWPHDRLVLGASRLIREADRVVPGKKLTVHANRGLSGIDGTIATANGIALASQADVGGVTRVLVGDLAFLHDVGALLFGEGETRPRLQVIVGNDGGGTIFDKLEVAATASPAALDRVLYTPQSADIRLLAGAYGWDYRRAATRGELDEALIATSGPIIVEVPLPRE